MKVACFQFGNQIVFETMIAKLRGIGPGLMLAAAAIGVSHLVQSTRAGADYGYQLLVVIVLTNVLKYPFFEIGHRYFLATGETLLQGYKKLGRGYLQAFLFFNLIGAIGTIAAVTFVTAALVQNLMGSFLSVPLWSCLILSVCVVLLLIGHYKWLDIFIKLLMVVLLLTTLSAVVFLFFKESVQPVNMAATQEAFSWTALPFLIALMGWMPAPIELSVWQSLWLEAQSQLEGKAPSSKLAQFDFNFGYICTILMALAFAFLGAKVMYGSGVTFSAKPFEFAAQVVDLYSVALGDWSRPIIAVAALTAMFSTTITCVDSYPRSLAEGFELLSERQVKRRLYSHSFWIVLISVVGLVLIAFFATSLKRIVDVVTIVSFLTAPFFAFLNLKLIRSPLVSEPFRQSRWLYILSLLGMSFLIAFGALFLYSRWLA
ncbi:MAG: Nramp family divalent metal transporter [Bdellovibrionales bacterium]|nr:Nramp family divalent metal transporter [Bdellovibrionales bacterium]